MRKTGIVAAEASLQNLLNEYELYCQQYEQLEQLMMGLLLQVPNAEKLLDIKGVGLLATNPEFRQLHKKNISRENNPLNKMQLIIALCGKLIRVFYALLRTGADYSAEKMLGDIELGMKATA